MFKPASPFYIDNDYMFYDLKSEHLFYINGWVNYIKLTFVIFVEQYIF